CRYRSHGRLNEAAAAADASRGLTGQLRCPKNKIGVSRKMSIEYPYEQLPCQTQGGFLQTALSTVTRRSRSCSSPVLLRRVTPDRALAFPVTDPSRKAASHDYSDPHTDVLLRSEEP